MSYQPTVSLRQPLLGTKMTPPSSGERLAEVAGGTVAECAVVCCCCPCGLVNLLVLAVYKLPSGLCRKALRRRNVLLRRRRRLCECCSNDETEVQINPISGDVTPVAADKHVRRLKSSEKEMLEVEKEMWDGFYGAGFWRSPS